MHRLKSEQELSRQRKVFYIVTEVRKHNEYIEKHPVYDDSNKQSK